MQNNISKESTKFEILLQDGQKIVNNVYQLKVAEQGDASCGPRALYNVHCLKNVFEKNNDGSYAKSIDCLEDLNNLNNNVENPNFRSFIIQMHGATETFNETDKHGNLILDDKGERVKKIIRIFAGEYDFDRNNGAPQWVFQDKLQKFIDFCEPKNNRPFKIIDIDIMPGYEQSFTLLESKEQKDAKNIAVKNIGYCHGFVILDGEYEPHHGHYTSILVVKTGNNQYNWFFLNSSNNDFTNQDFNERIDQIKAYIYKLQGNNYTKYLDIIDEKKYNDRMTQDTKTLDGIEKRINNLIMFNKDNKNKEGGICISGDKEMEKYMNTYSTSKNKLNKEDTVKAFFIEQISILNKVKGVDIKKGDSLSEKINCLKKRFNIVIDKEIDK